MHSHLQEGSAKAGVKPVALYVAAHEHIIYSIFKADSIAALETPLTPRPSGEMHDSFRSDDGTGSQALENFRPSATNSHTDETVLDSGNVTIRPIV